jgi:hypothetical protein
MHLKIMIFILGFFLVQNVNTKPKKIFYFIDVEIGGDKLENHSELQLIIYFKDGTKCEEFSINTHVKITKMGTYTSYESIDLCKTGVFRLEYIPKSWDKAANKPKEISSLRLHLVQHTLTPFDSVDNVNVTKIAVRCSVQDPPNVETQLEKYCFIPDGTTEARLTAKDPYFTFLPNASCN